MNNQKIENIEKQPNSWLNKKIRTIWWGIHAKMPNTIPSPYGDDVEYFRNRDDVENNSTLVSSLEELRLDAIWGVELYGPSEIDQLYFGLEKLGWNADDLNIKNGGASEWIKQKRLYGAAGGNLNLGCIRHRGEEAFLPSSYFAPLPNEVDFIIAEIYQLSPSLTGVAIGFIFNDEHAKCYQREINKSKRTFKESIKKRSISILDVRHQKQRAVEKVRTKHRNIVVEWFEENLPGFFCLEKSGNRLPTTELITSKDFNILEAAPYSKTTRLHWSSLLQSDRCYDTWTYSNYDGLRARFDELDGNSRFHTLVTLRTDGISEKELELLGGRSTDTFIAYAHRRISGIIVLHAAIAFLREVGRTLKISRESLISSKVHSNHTLKSLKDIEEFFDASLGIPAIVNELIKASEDEKIYCWNCDEFYNTPLFENERAKTITEVIRTKTKYLANKIVAEEEMTREHFEQISSIMSTRESIRAQRKMEILTVIATVSGLGSLWVALSTSPDFSKKIDSLLENLGVI